MHRLEQADHDPHVYTAVENGMLAVQGWMRTIPRGDPGFPAGAIVLDGFESVPGNRQAQLRACISRMVHDVADRGPAPLFAVVRRNDAFAIGILRELGFRNPDMSRQRIVERV